VDPPQGFSEMTPLVTYNCTLILHSYGNMER